VFYFFSTLAGILGGGKSGMLIQLSLYSTLHLKDSGLAMNQPPLEYYQVMAKEQQGHVILTDLQLQARY
jgi:hypothetical protein